MSEHQNDKVMPMDSSPKQWQLALATRIGKVTMAIPQVRDCDFYPSSLEKGMRSERALKLALAEMSGRRLRGEDLGIRCTSREFPLAR